MAPPMEKIFQGGQQQHEIRTADFQPKKEIFSQKNSGHPWLCFGKLETQLTLLM